MHKYWGKKPAPHLKSLIERYSNRGDIVFEPFAGYGVFSCEAYLLNRNVIVNDLNPIAHFINHRLFSVNVNLDKLLKDWQTIKEQFQPFADRWYRWVAKGETVNVISTLRDKNDRPIRIKYKGTNGKPQEYALSSEESAQFLNFEQAQIIEDWYPDDFLIENARISAKKGMRVSDLFTKRTLVCHAKLLKLINTHSTGEERELLKLAFTANLANCSKLVPPIQSRGLMSQGAWMTGFYIGNSYLENNVLMYFENRVNKIIKGKREYLNLAKPLLPMGDGYTITQSDARYLSLDDNSVDYIFVDPPYGNAVPYFEQSMIWNAWLQLPISYPDEIVVSDSKVRNKNIAAFEKDIHRVFSELRRVLKPQGFLSLSYHSISGLEWRTITNACIRNGFTMTQFEWLEQKNFTPRQIKRNNGIKGDMLITFQKSPHIRFRVADRQETKRLLLGCPSASDLNQAVFQVMKSLLEQNLILDDADLFRILRDNLSKHDKPANPKNA